MELYYRDQVQNFTCTLCAQNIILGFVIIIDIDVFVLCKLIIFSLLKGYTYIYTLWADHTLYNTDHGLNYTDMPNMKLRNNESVSKNCTCFFILNQIWDYATGQMKKKLLWVESFGYCVRRRTLSWAQKKYLIMFWLSCFTNVKQLLFKSSPISKHPYEAGFFPPKPH